MKLMHYMKAAGELAVRRMSYKAQEGYYGTDPLDLYEYEVYEDDSDEPITLYAVKSGDEEKRDLTFEEAEQELESYYFEDEEED